MAEEGRGMGVQPRTEDSLRRNLVGHRIRARPPCCCGFSKNFALAGLRVGCVVATDAAWMKQIIAASDAESTVYGVSVLSQVAVIAALQQGRGWLADFVRHLRGQRDYTLERLARWPG